VLRGEPAVGTEATGPVAFELPETTLVLPPDWTAKVDDAGTIVARFETPQIGGKRTAQ
jgi:N-methylhydantoinase A/oxoprolinase/acetone carboxylase beta subunit